MKTKMEKGPKSNVRIKYIIKIFMKFAVIICKLSVIIMKFLSLFHPCSADVNKEPGTGVMMTSATVNHTGGVFWAAPAIFHSSCKLDITFFPFDRQMCHLKFGPWAYLGNQVQMKKKAGTSFKYSSVVGRA